MKVALSQRCSPLVFATFSLFRKKSQLSSLSRTISQLFRNLGPMAWGRNVKLWTTCCTCWTNAYSLIYRLPSDSFQRNGRSTVATIMCIPLSVHWNDVKHMYMQQATGTVYSGGSQQEGVYEFAVAALSSAISAPFFGGFAQELSNFK